MATNYNSSKKKDRKNARKKRQQHVEYIRNRASKSSVKLTIEEAKKQFSKQQKEEKQQQQKLKNIPKPTHETFHIQDFATQQFKRKYNIAYSTYKDFPSMSIDEQRSAITDLFSQVVSELSSITTDDLEKLQDKNYFTQTFLDTNVFAKYFRVDIMEGKIVGADSSEFDEVLDFIENGTIYAPETRETIFNDFFKLLGYKTINKATREQTIHNKDLVNEGITEEYNRAKSAGIYKGSLNDYTAEFWELFRNITYKDKSRYDSAATLSLILQSDIEMDFRLNKEELANRFKERITPQIVALHSNRTRYSSAKEEINSALIEALRGPLEAGIKSNLQPVGKPSPLKDEMLSLGIRNYNSQNSSHKRLAREIIKDEELREALHNYVREGNFAGEATSGTPPRIETMEELELRIMQAYDFISKEE